MRTHVNKLAEKYAQARLRACFGDEVTHIRAGDWQGIQDAEVTFVGTAAQLHGTVCTCCPAVAS